MVKFFGRNGLEIQVSSRKGTNVKFFTFKEELIQIFN